eukprot:2399576-Rhodomonas_salina.2
MGGRDGITRPSQVCVAVCVFAFTHCDTFVSESPQSQLPFQFQDSSKSLSLGSPKNFFCRIPYTNSNGPFRASDSSTNKGEHPQKPAAEHSESVLGLRAK